VTENFLMAFKNYDVEMLDKARAPQSLMFVDPDFQDFARKLSFLTSSHKDTAAAAAAVAEAPRRVDERKPNLRAESPIAEDAEVFEDMGAALDSVNIEDDDDFEALVNSGGAPEAPDSLPQPHLSQVPADDDEIDLS
jgi:hypothetical protein